MEAVTEQGRVLCSLLQMSPKSQLCRAWNSLQYAFLSGFLLPGNFTRRDGIVSETVYINKASTNTDPYDQYEFSFALEHAADCLKKV